MKIPSMQESSFIFHTPLAFVATLPLFVSFLLTLASILIFVRIPIVDSLLALPYKAIARLGVLIGIFHSKQQWSIVYDSQTHQPIDPAYVTVRNTLGVEIASMITDLNGRFAVILQRGVYTVTVQKTNYVFPSTKNFQNNSDGEYHQVYLGETIEVLEAEQPLTIAIPMDPVSEDWNQSEKRRKNIFVNVGNENHFDITQLIYIALASLLATAHFYTYGSTWSVQLLVINEGVLCAMALWYCIEPSRSTESTVLDRVTKEPVAFARVTIFNKKTETQVMRKTTSFNGQFVCLLPKGRYYLSIERRDDRGMYTQSFISETLRVRSGVLGKVFII